MNPHHPHWKFSLPLITAAFLLLSLAYFVSSSKKDFKDLSYRQSLALSKIERIYISLADLARQSAQDEGAGGSNGQLLRYSDVPASTPVSSRVLGIEDTPAVKRLRLLGGYFKEGRETSREITSLVKTIGEKHLSLGSALLYPDTSQLRVKTSSLAQDLEELFTYLERDNNSGVRQVAVLSDLVDRFDLLLANGSKVNFQQVQDDLSNFDAEISALTELGPFTKSTYLTQYHHQRKTQLVSIKGSLDGLLQAIRTEDTPRIISRIGDFNSLISGSGLEVAREIEFWQTDLAARGVANLRNDWDLVTKRL